MSFLRMQESPTPCINPHNAKYISFLYTYSEFAKEKYSLQLTNILLKLVPKISTNIRTKNKGVEMHQSKFSIEESHIDFLNQYSQFGYKDKSTMVRAALDELKKRLELKELRESADLYTEIYAGDDELSELTDTAVTDWPEK